MFKPSLSLWSIVTLWLCLSGVFISCASYVTPGGPADFTTLTDPKLKKAYQSRPAAKFPANVAAIRVQAVGYQSDSLRGFGHGNYSVVTSLDVETEDDIIRMAAIPGIDDVVRINRLLLPESLNSDLELRNAAAKLHTDMIFLYTFDTTFQNHDVLRPLTTVSLGLAPTQTFKAQATAAGLLMDTRTGYIYAVLEETAKQGGLATAWGSSEAMQRARKKAEREAFDKLLANFETTWPRVYRKHRQR